MKQIVRENIKPDDKRLYKDSAKTILNPYCFTDKNLRNGFNINLESHHMNHATSKKLSNQTLPKLELNSDLLVNSQRKRLIFVLE